MTPEEIIKIDATRRNIAAKQSIGRINTMFQTGGQMVQDDKTLFTFLSNGKGLVRFHAYTADDLDGLRESLKKFVKLMQGTGARELFVICPPRPKYLSFLESVYDDLGLEHRQMQHEKAIILTAVLKAE
jgi:hypothetical protein